MSWRNFFMDSDWRDMDLVSIDDVVVGDRVLLMSAFSGLVLGCAFRSFGVPSTGRSLRKLCLTITLPFGPLVSTGLELGFSKPDEVEFGRPRDSFPLMSVSPRRGVSGTLDLGDVALDAARLTVYLGMVLRPRSLGLTLLPRIGLKLIRIVLR